MSGYSSRCKMTTWVCEMCRVARYQPCKLKLPTPVICLCGSTRFTREMLVKQWELTKEGYIVLSWCALPDDYYSGVEKAHIGDQEGVKEFVDEIHKRKIDLADEVLVIDVGGYIGESTRSEIDYAIKHGKPVRYLSDLWRQQELLALLTDRTFNPGGRKPEHENTDEQAVRQDEQILEEKCMFMDCNRPARYEGWFDRRDFSGAKTGLSMKMKVCEGHKKELRQQERDRG